MARPLSEFVARLFRVEAEHQALLDLAAREQAIFRLKEFVARRASKKYRPAASPPGEAPDAARAR